VSTRHLQPLRLIVLILATWMGHPGMQVHAQVETRLYLVRHAEKESDGTNDPGLTPVGLDRAQRLADLLSDAGLTRLYSTDWKRTRSTLAPIARRTGLTVQLYDWKDAASVEAMLADCMGQVALICGHSNSTPWLVNLLLQSEEYEPLAEDEYGKLFRLILIDGQLQDVTVSDY